MSDQEMQDEFEAWLSRQTGQPVEQLKSFRSYGRNYGNTPGDGYARGALEMGLEAWIACRSATAVNLPTFDGYQRHIVEELQAAFTCAMELRGFRVRP